MKVNFFFVITFFILSLGFSQTSYKMDRLIKPENLKIGDTISIIAPSGVLKDYDKYMDKSINLMKSWGLNVVLGSSIYDNYGHFSSADINREKDFQNAIDDNKIKAIWCARGGYGAMRIIDNINYENLLKVAHSIMVTAMSVKQKPEKALVKQLRTEIKSLHKMYEER